MSIFNKKTINLLSKYQPSNVILPKIAAIIKKNKKFLLTTHIGPDPDGLGSEIALYFLLKKLKKEVIILNNEKTPDLLSFIDSTKKIQFLSDHELKQGLWDNKINDYFVFVLDCSELKRIDKVADLFIKLKLSWASIDHHLTPPEKNLFIDADYSATAEIIWDLYHYLKIPIDKKTALALYSGIVADSGNFRYSKTSLRTHLAGGELLQTGIDSDEIYRMIFEAHPIDRLILKKRIFSKLIINKKLGYVIGQYRRRTSKNLSLGDSPTEGVINSLLSVSGIKIAALFTETAEGDMKCSLRSVGNVSVAKIAEKYGGGGHKNAAGLRIKLPYRKARKIIIKEIEEYLS
ncbi:MAG: bifunctional oligoribonuclease/PAP phosphatase NrnA [Spirochaetia bacterium]|nr:bifunctional oligoribonuclease/PAP phosphatase NrnA [Spirochaetia bacterium]